MWFIWRQNGQKPLYWGASISVMHAMTEPQDHFVRYSRSRFQSRLPTAHRYTASHFWLSQLESDLWRVGFTRFATRMLGELVELDFEIKTGDLIKIGQTIGWVEGFKAVTDLYSVGEGEFVRGNPALAQQIELLTRETYAEGWLYEFRGQPEPDAVDVHGYTGILDLAIDKVQGKAT